MKDQPEPVHVTSISTLHRTLEEFGQIRVPQLGDMLSDSLHNNIEYPAGVREYIRNAPLAHQLLLQYLVSKGLVFNVFSESSSEISADFDPAPTDIINAWRIRVCAIEFETPETHQTSFSFNDVEQELETLFSSVSTDKKNTPAE